MRSLQDPGLPQGDCPSPTLHVINRKVHFLLLCLQVLVNSPVGAIFVSGSSAREGCSPPRNLTSILPPRAALGSPPAKLSLPSLLVCQTGGGKRASRPEACSSKVILQAVAHIGRKVEKAREGGSIVFHQSQEAICYKSHHYLSPTKEEKMLLPVHL